MRMRQIFKRIAKPAGAEASFYDSGSNLRRLAQVFESDEIFVDPERRALRADVALISSSATIAMATVSIRNMSTGLHGVLVQGFAPVGLASTPTSETQSPPGCHCVT